MNIKFNNWLCKVVRSRYENGRVCLRLQDISTNAFVAMATTDLPHIRLDEDEVIIKFEDENEGILKALVTANVVLPPHTLLVTGTCAAPRHLAVCTLLLGMDDIPVAFGSRH